MRGLRTTRGRCGWLLVLPLSACVAEYQAIPQADEEPSTGATATEPVPGETQDILECEEDFALCDGVCVDLDWDSQHCGECEQMCLLGTECIDGQCLGPCGEDCDDPARYCDDGVCRCRPEMINCNGLCVDPRNDPDHCGDCWDACSGSTPLCGEGTCLSDCDDFQDACSEWCTDLEIDPLNCGGCDLPCAVGETCVEGDCVPYVQLDAVQCGTCPCDEICPFACCESEILDAAICVESLLCPGD
ncbi:MAG: hypothetical protein K0V04_15755 [Deltaproteobacteria bacterium]|nr:hypothetical protein [Deltaproteobacteria bacterium]